MILLPASEMHQLFLRISRHSTSSASSWASVLIHFSEVHETSLRWCLTLSHWPLRDVHPPPPLLFLGLSKRPSPVGAEVGAVPYSRQWRGITLPFPKRENRSLSYPMGQKNRNCLSLLDDWVLQKNSLFGSVEPSPLNVRLQMEKVNLRYTLELSSHLQFIPSSPNNCLLFSLGQKVLGWTHCDSGFILSHVLVVFWVVYCTHKVLIRPSL